MRAVLTSPQSHQPPLPKFAPSSPPLPASAMPSPASSSSRTTPGQPLSASSSASQPNQPRIPTGLNREDGSRRVSFRLDSKSGTTLAGVEAGEEDAEGEEVREEDAVVDERGTMGRECCRVRRRSGKMSRSSRRGCWGSCRSRGRGRGSSLSQLCARL